MLRQSSCTQSVRFLGGVALFAWACSATPMEGTDCRLVPPCGSGTYCDRLTGRCLTGCATAEECGSGFSCDTTTHACYSTEPTITMVSPDPLPLNGGNLTVVGTNFRAGVGLTAILDGTTATFMVVSSTQLIVEAPAVATCGTRMLTLRYPNGGIVSAPVRYGPCAVIFTGTKLTGPVAPTANALSAGRVQVADFNLDGSLDILFTNSEQNTLYVFRGDGTGKFSAAVTTALSSAPNAFSVGDYNKDGKLDVPILDAMGNGIQLYNGNGTGTFTTGLRTPFTNAFGAKAPTPVDYNGDGIVDLPVSNATSITMLLGSSTSPYQLGQQYTIANVNALISGDFNNDSKMDLLAVQTMGMNSAVQFLRGNGNGTLAVPMQVSTSYLEGIPGDYDRDGKLDLQVGGMFHHGNGDGTFTQGPTSFVGNEARAATDFNQDGALDIVVSITFLRDAQVYLGKGDGNFQTAGTILPSTDQVTSVAVGDLNKDGLPDVVLGNKPTSAMAQTIDIFLAASK